MSLYYLFVLLLALFILISLYIPNNPEIITTADGIATASTAFNTILLTYSVSTKTIIVNLLQSLTDRAIVDL